jgi:FlaA1/EpsC-like NDP-sugar epimerase
LLAPIARQVEQGEPVTVTDPEVTRYFMTVEEAVGMVLSVASMATSGEMFVLDMGEPGRIMDLVRRYAPSNSVSGCSDKPHRLASGRETAREAIQQEGGARAHC